MRVCRVGFYTNYIGFIAMIMYQLCAMLLVMISGSVWGMEVGSPVKENNPLVNSFQTPPRKYTYNPKSPFQKDTVLFSDDNAIQNQIIQRINETPQGGYIHIQSPFISLWKLELALKEAVERGVQVHVDLTGRSPIVNKLKDIGVTVRVIPGLHTKRVLVASQHPEKFDESSEAHLFVGSDNISNISSGHKEVMEYSRNDKDWVFKQYQDIIKSSDSKLEVLKLVDDTPLKKTMTSTREYDVNASKMKRIATIKEVLDQDSNTPFYLDIASMTFDQKEIADIVALVTATATNRNSGTQKVRVFLDKSADTQKNEPLLVQMSDAGVEVYIYNKAETRQASRNYLSLQHQKTIIRYIQGHDPEYLTITSTGNLTDNSQREQNVDSYDQLKDKFDLIKNQNDLLAQESTRYISKAQQPDKKKKKFQHN